MEFLRFLESIRTPAVSALMSSLTYLGDQTVVFILGLVVFWCVSKRQGYYIFVVSLGGTVINQWLKMAFRIPRPWVLDPNFTIVESARAAATGYSFPSGHTHSSVSLFGAIAISNRQKPLRVICGAFILLVPFSRMYLGCHTPLDVGVAFAVAVALLAALWPCFRDEERFLKTIRVVLCASLAVSLAYALWINLTAFPADVDEENLAHGVQNGWTLLGCMLGLLLSLWYDQKKLHFDEKAPLLGQVAKVALGLLVIVVIRVAAKPLLNAVAGDALWTNAVRYFLMVAFAGCLWPMTFPYFAKIGSKSKS